MGKNRKALLRPSINPSGKSMNHISRGLSVRSSPFRALLYAADAVSIRRWDEAAKVPGIPTPDLEYYRATLQTALKS